MATPPSWAYPYATVWDDFDALSVVSMDGSLANSGQPWAVPTDGMTYGFGISPYTIAHTHLVADSRGINQGMGHESVMGWPAGMTPPPDNFIGDQYALEQYVLVPGATSENFFVRMEFFCPSFHATSNTGQSIDGLAAVPSIEVKNGWFFDNWQVGYDVLISTNPFQVLYAFPGGPYPGDFFGTGAPSVPEISLYNSAELVLNYRDSWHTWELRSERGLLTLLVDNSPVYQGPNNQVPFFDSVYVSAVAGVDADVAAPEYGKSAYVDHFQAGPTSLISRVPQLSVGQGPQHVRFEPPRVI